MSERFFVGVDGGGTNTRAILVDSTGRVLGYARAGSTNRNHYDRDMVRANMRDALRGAMGNAAAGNSLEAIFLGMCGVSTDSDRQDLISIVREIREVPASTRIDVDNDTRIGLIGGLSGRPGIVLIAGTGSACFGLDAADRSYLCAGWGALADDAGSAPWIGLQAINAAVKSEDGRLGPTSLREMVFRFLELSHPRELIDRVHNRGLERGQIGQLAPRVIEAHLRGDAIATEILNRAAGELSSMVAVTARKLFGTEPCEMILVGGVALSGAPFQPMLVDRIQKETPSVKVCDPEMSPVKGAALAALKMAGVPYTSELLKNLSSYAE